MKTHSTGACLMCRTGLSSGKEAVRHEDLQSSTQDFLSPLTTDNPGSAAAAPGMILKEFQSHDRP